MSTILFEVKDGIAFITFNRPAKLNSIGREMADKFHDLLMQCRERKDVRCLYVTGAGNAFCAGQDLSEVMNKDTNEMNLILREQYNPIVYAIRTIEKPVIAAVNGVAAGAGANIAFCCDVVLAASSAYFTQAFANIALVPDTGGTYILPRFIGWQRASALMMLADKIPAQDAEEMGMIYRVFPDFSFKSETMKIAKRLAKMPTKTLGMIKHALNKSVTNTFEQQLEVEDSFQRKALHSKDYKEGVTAFLEKREADFKGE
ncbi:MAG TPA: enoyl-CoA hydratase-related protein [Chitinophagaceae bacterium]|nr:enoyl-CoA hydratase-related protein [Chitinophagaceae bacterium]